MKKRTKALLLVLCALMLVTTSVMGTVAYLTSTAGVANTFTVGDIAIKLDETAVGADGKAVEPAARTEEGNKDVKLIPGRTITKDPTVWVRKGSEPAYIRMKVTISNYAALKSIFGESFLPQDYVEGWDKTTWVPTNDVATDNTKDTATYEFRYKEIYTAPIDNIVDFAQLPALFQTFTLPGEGIGNTELATLEGLTITVVAEAIQAETFANADAAWAAFDS